MIGYSQQLQVARIPHSFVYDNDLAQAEIVITSGQINDSDNEEEKPIDDWEIPASEAALDLFEHPDVLAMEKANPGTSGFIRQSVKNYNESESVGDFLFNISLNNAANTLIAKMLFNRLTKGGTHFRKGQYVLSHTQTISSAYSKNLVDTNVLKVYSFSKLKTEITDSSLVVKCPPRLLAKIDGIFANQKPTGIDVTGFLNSAGIGNDHLWGWLKSPSPERLIAGNKIQITTNYTLELWSLLEYPSPIT